MFRIDKLAVATFALTGMVCVMGAAQPAQAQYQYQYNQSRNGYYYLGQYYNSWPAVRHRITGSVAPGSTYSVGRGSNRRYYQHRNLPGLWGYNTREEYQTNLNLALKFGGR